ncbi:MAG: hypothetical protein Q7S66_04425 [bacterium]|nr:hypothetical protein [bacterium]
MREGIRGGGETHLSLKQMLESRAAAGIAALGVLLGGASAEAKPRGGVHADKKPKVESVQKAAPAEAKEAPRGVKERIEKDTSVGHAVLTRLEEQKFAVDGVEITQRATAFSLVSEGDPAVEGDEYSIKWRGVRSSMPVGDTNNVEWQETIEPDGKVGSIGTESGFEVITASPPAVSDRAKKTKITVSGARHEANGRLHNMSYDWTILKGLVDLGQADSTEGKHFKIRLQMRVDNFRTDFPGLLAPKAEANITAVLGTGEAPKEVK